MNHDAEGLQRPPDLGTSPTVSAVSWPAILAGAIVAAATSIILVFLGTGIGLASASPWSHSSGAGPTAFALGTAIWFVVLQWIPSGIGGFLVGRLRVKWVSLHTHEVFFRDTAHGFITWSLATLIAAFVITSVGSIGAKRVTEVASSAMQAWQGSAGAGANMGAYSEAGYDMDLLFRSDRSETNAALNDVVSLGDNRIEVTRILEKEFSDGSLSAADRDYLETLTSKRTGISRAAAETRVNDVAARVDAASAKAKQDAEKAKKAAAAAALFTALSLFIGAFIACVAAALGGGFRDEHI